MGLKEAEALRSVLALLWTIREAKVFQQRALSLLEIWGKLAIEK